jgi:Cu/Ag efflux pump CusA
MKRLIALAMQRRRLVIVLAALLSLGGLGVVSTLFRGTGVAAGTLDATPTLLQATLLAILAVVIFMGHLRSALLVTLHLLMALLAAVLAAALAFRGGAFPAGLGTLAGLTVAVGLVGDGAIVLVENSVRLLGDPFRRGRSRPALVLEAARQVSRPVLLGHAVLVLVFCGLVRLPIPGSQLFTPLAALVLMALGITLVETFTVLPALASWTLRPGPIFPAGRIPHPGDLIRRVYRPHLARALRHPGLVVGAATGFLGMAALVIPTLSTAPRIPSGALGQLVWRTPLVLGLIFGLLFLHFRRLQPVVLSVMAVPLAVAGGLFGLAFTGLELSLPAAVGLFALLGLAVPGSLVMIELFRDLAIEGKSRDEATRMGAELGLRPVLLIAATRVLALAPLLWASGADWRALRPLAVVVISGVGTATALTLTVLPVLYRWLGGSATRSDEASDQAIASSRPFPSG